MKILITFNFIKQFRIEEYHLAVFINSLQMDLAESYNSITILFSALVVILIVGGLVIRVLIHIEKRLNPDKHNPPSKGAKK